MKPHQYAPGTVAMIRLVDAINERRALRVGNIGWHLRPSDHDEFVLDDKVADVRPLVELDPATIPDLRAYLPEMSGDYDHDDHRLVAVIKEIEAQIKPPKPAEPTGLGAVVEDVEGVRWVKFSSKSGDWWRNHPGRIHRWADITAVRVLSEGVS